MMKPGTFLRRINDPLDRSRIKHRGAQAPYSKSVPSALNFTARSTFGPRNIPLAGKIVAKKRKETAIIVGRLIVALTVPDKLYDTYIYGAG